MAKYKIGDRVKIREDLVPGKYYGIVCFSEEMNCYKGKTLTVSKTLFDKFYYVEEDDKFFIWSDEMFEDKQEQEDENINHFYYFNIFVEKVIYNNPATIMFYKDLNNKSRKIVTKCKKGDVFNKRIGFEVCLYKAFKKEAERKLKQY